uniref:Uncharacterized protein n=1 Tax=Anguilla anguilla TaxID=7936 RepID=A0A0E9S8P4_ANGAN
MESVRTWFICHFQTSIEKCSF